MPLRKDSSYCILETPSLNLDNPVRDILIVISFSAKQQKINDLILSLGLLVFTVVQRAKPHLS